MTDYLHALAGRMRIKISVVKDSPAAAAEVAGYLGGCPGVEEVSANPLTGNVLIRYKVEQISQGQILNRLRDGGYLKPAAPGPDSRGERLVAVLARAVMETALQSMVMALM
jgi:hypothetical protein